MSFQLFNSNESFVALVTSIVGRRVEPPKMEHVFGLRGVLSAANVASDFVIFVMCLHMLHQILFLFVKLATNLKNKNIF